VPAHTRTVSLHIASLIYMTAKSAERSAVVLSSSSVLLLADTRWCVLAVLSKLAEQ
jgi:hypothetical protein